MIEKFLISLDLSSGNVQCTATFRWKLATKNVADLVSYCIEAMEMKLFLLCNKNQQNKIGQSHLFFHSIDWGVKKIAGVCPNMLE